MIGPVVRRLKRTDVVIRVAYMFAFPVVSLLDSTGFDSAIPADAKLLVVQGRHLGQAALVAFGPAEAGGHERLDEFPRQRRTDYPSTHAKHVHVVVFDSLVRRVNVVDKTGTNAGHLVGGDRRSHATSAEGQAPFDFLLCHRPCQGYNEIGVVIPGRSVDVRRNRRLHARRSEGLQLFPP